MTAQKGSIAAGARALNMAPPLATRKIAQLEKGLNARLFERTTRSLKLTEAGAIALVWAKEALDAQEEVLDRLASLQVKPSGLVRLVSTQLAASEYLPAVLARFAERHRGIRLSLSTTDSLLNLVEHTFDVAVHSGLPPDSSLVGKRVQVFDRVLCATPAYLKRRGVPLHPRDLAGHDCIAHSANEPRHWHFMRDKELHLQVIDPFIEADNYSVILGLVRESMGIARLALPVVKEDIEAGRMVPVMQKYACVHPNGDRPGLWVLYPNRKVLYRTRLLVDHLVATLQE